MGNAGAFKKGHTPWNKGIKYSERQKEKLCATAFKSGHVPWNKKAVGDEKLAQGYTYIKIAEPNVWKLKHRYIWEQAYGEIPPNCNIIFLDGDKTNFNLSNLFCVHRNILIRMSQDGLFFNDSDNTKTGVKIAELSNAISSKRKRRDRQ